MSDDEMFQTNDLVLASCLCALGFGYELVLEDGVCSWRFVGNAPLYKAAYQFGERELRVEPESFLKLHKSMRSEMFKTLDGAAR